ncbi:PmbA protein [Candidatus Coxiella mudrowiae]|uniref:PmbA protein n=2 Tax=Candidatus Coxiella mudrowiae TaxID=2054173 RepID=A0ABM5UTY1_9COXI|nr:PmbA protein [Candidatus Coxiella mudrowiae]AKQ33504.1 PmbA protein [Candidatus Coxiella mudrowiae]
MANNQEKLQFDILRLLDRAKKRVDQVEISAGIETGFSVDVRLGAVETVEHHRENSLDITIYHQQRTGSASTSDLSFEAMETAFDKACTIAQFTQEDPYAGLADVADMALDYPNLTLYHPWQITPKEAIELAIECETVARKYDPRIKNSDGATVNTYDSFRIYANSHGFLGHYPSTIHSMSCSLVAEQNNQMQRDHDYTLARSSDKLLPINLIAQHVAEKTIRRLGARKITTRRCPIIFDAPVAKGMWRSLISAIQGSNLYRDASFLCGQLHQQIFPKFITIYQEPHLPGEIGSAPFDENGVKTRKINYVENGVLTNYILDAYSARKLGMKTTGNAEGVFNLFITAGDKDLIDLFKEMQTGLFVTDLMGQGVNLLTGNYSRGAFGYWIENGEIQYPVEEITISGNLKEMFKQIQVAANDIDPRSSIKTGSILIEQMTVAGE